MVDLPGRATPIPLVALSDVVHFPHTDLKLHIFEPKYRRLVRDLIEMEDDESRWIGMVLIQPEGPPTSEGRPAVFPSGTAGRLMEAELLPDGRSEILLHGEFRFELEREVGGGPYRQAVVRPVEEPSFDDQDAGVLAVRGGIVETARSLAVEEGDALPFSPDQVEQLAERFAFEELVNQLAAGLDLPALRKLELLSESVLDRALSVLSILKSRREVVDMLRPYRHLAGGSKHN